MVAAIKTKPGVTHPVASELHSPATVQLLQLAAQAAQAVPETTNVGLQVKLAVVEQVKVFALHATQFPASRVNSESHEVQASTVHTAQAVPQAVQESSAAKINLAKQVVQTVAESHTLQLAPQASQAVEALIKKVGLHEVQAVVEVQVRHAVPQESQPPVAFITYVAKHAVQVAAGLHVVQKVGQASQVNGLLIKLVAQVVQVFYKVQPTGEVAQSAEQPAAQEVPSKTLPAIQDKQAVAEVQVTQGLTQAEHALRVVR